MAIALHHSRAKGAAKLILVGIANHDGDGGAWPTMATLAKYGGVTKAQAQKCVAKLEQLGEIRRHVQQGGYYGMDAWRRPNRYTFMLRCPHNCDRSARHRVPADGELELEFVPDAQLAHPPASAIPPRVSAGGPPRVGDTQTVRENQLLKYPKKPQTARAARAACGHELVDDRHCTHGCPIAKETLA